MKKILWRVQEPTPRFFRHIRNVGLLLSGLGGALLTAPVALPALLLSAGGYLVLAGALASVLSQTAVEHDRLQ